MDSQQQGSAGPGPTPTFRGMDIRTLGEHGLVRLVDYMGSDVNVVRAARVSHDAAWRAGEDEASDKKLIRYLYKNSHLTPFEAVTFTFEIKAPIFVFRQWHRHRTWSYNELSARYRELPEEFFVPDPAKIGAPDPKNKQARVERPASLATERQVTMYTEHCLRAFALYRDLLNAGWPKELARMCLPLSTYSVMFGTVNLRNLLAFLTLRDHAHAQPEIRVYAAALRDLAMLVCPVSVSVWKEESSKLPYAELEQRCGDLAFENERLRTGGSNR